MITFDKEAHKYYYCGVEMPSVSEILTMAGYKGKPDAIPEAVWKRAASFGTAVHETTQYDDLGTLDEVALDDKLRAHLADWRIIKKRVGIEKFEAVEVIAYSLTEWFCGTVDRVYFDGKKRIIMDIKTGRKAKGDPLQIAGAYKMGYEEMTGLKVDECWGVYLRGDGKPKIEVYDPAKYALEWYRALVKYREGMNLIQNAKES